MRSELAVMRELAVRDAVDADVAQIAILISELGYPTADVAMRKRLMLIAADSSFRTLVAEADGRIVGLAGVGIAPFYEHDGLYGRLLALVVADGYRSCGVGKALVDAAEAWVAERGATAMVVGTGQQRKRAHSFYERAGYMATGIRYVKELKSPR